MKPALTIHIDLSGLNGYLAIRGTFEMIDELGVDVSWLPITGLLARVSSKQPASAAVDPLAAYKLRRQKARDSFANHELARNCRQLGISSRQALVNYDPTLVHIGLMYLTGRDIDPRSYITAVYESAFKLDQPIAEAAGVIDLLNKLDIDATGFEKFLDGGRQLLTELEQRLLEEGVFDSPAYIYQGERFHGRQHLPLLRWYLTGSTGTPPV